MKKGFSIQNWAAPLILLAFTGQTVNYFNVFFNSTTRWLVLLFVLLIVISDRFVSPMLRMYPLRLSLVYALWAMFTYFWSESPLLSIMKGMALFLVIYGASGIGFIWARKSTLKSALNAMLPMVFMVLCSGVLGLNTIEKNNAENGLIMYQGLTNNANMYGSLCAMSLPFSLWKYENMVKSKQRLFWACVCIYFAVNAFVSNSRAAMIVMVFTFIGLNIGKSISQKIVLLRIAIFVSLLIGMFLSQSIVKSFNTIITKGSTNQSITASREIIWEESYDQAVKGGFFGGGCGVTIGSDTVFEGGAASSSYGREKGNTQLAIIEETGLIGLGLYLLSTFMIIVAVSKRWQTSRNVDENKLQGLMIGLLIGLFINSIFEAWYVAPAAPESIYYWFVVGLSLGLIKKKFPTGNYQ